MVSSCTSALNLRPSVPTVSLKRLGALAVSLEIWHVSTIFSIDAFVSIYIYSPIASVNRDLDALIIGCPNVLWILLSCVSVYKTYLRSSRDHVWIKK